MKQILAKVFLSASVVLGGWSVAQTNNSTPVASEKSVLEKPYNPKENAEEAIKKLIVEAGNSNKNILIQAGGNWCIWCLRFNDFVKKNDKLSQILNDNYLYYHLNYSPENKNEAVFKKYDKLVELGFPAFVILDSKGNLLHIQESEVLEEGKGYSIEKTMDFLTKWTPEKK